MVNPSRRKPGNAFKSYYAYTSARSVSPRDFLSNDERQLEQTCESVGQASQTYWVNASNSTFLPNSWRGVRFSALQEALSQVSMLPVDHNLYLSPEVSKRASDVLGLISENIDLEPPRFFPQDGEAAVFTWDTGSVKRLFTVDVDEFDLMDINRATMVRCDHPLPDGDMEEKLAAVLKELGGNNLISSATITLDSDV